MAKIKAFRHTALPMNSIAHRSAPYLDWARCLVCILGFAALLLVLPGESFAARVQVPVETSRVVRVVAANVSSGNFQRYEDPGIRIFKGLRPDVVAIQEFNYASTEGNGTDTPEAFREFVDEAFGAEFQYYREPYNDGGDIPNGVISRWPILSSGSWADPVVSNRGFAWARIDLPGTNDLYVVSVHFYGSGSASQRNTEAQEVKRRIQTHFPANAWVVVAGDLNTATRGESAVTTLKTFLSDHPIPTDAVSGGDPDTNQPRNRPYDFVLPTSNLNTRLVPVTIGAQSFPNGLVFDSRVFTPLSAVAPVRFADCDVFQMQHMAVVKDFRVTWMTQVWVEVQPAVLDVVPVNRLVWTGPSNQTYSVQTSGNLASTNWTVRGTATSSTTNYSFTVTNDAATVRFYRVYLPATP